MAGDQREEPDGLPDPLVAAIADPERGRNRLPYLLGLLDGDDPRERLAAALALCLVVDAHPDALEYVVVRLVDRHGDDAPIEVGHALDYLAARDPAAVDEAVSDLDDEREVRARRRLFGSGGGFARSEYLRSTPGDRPVGRTRFPGEGSGDDPRRVRTVSPREDPEAGVGETADERADATGEDADGETDSDTGRGDDGPTDESGAGFGAGTMGGSDGDAGVTRGTLAVVSERLSAVVARSRFDDLNVLTDRHRGRYGDVYRSVGTLGGEDYPVALTVFRLPGDGRQAFVRRYAAAMERWEAVADHDRILSVFDWGTRPRPWATLEYADGTLADRPTDGTAADSSNAGTAADAATDGPRRDVAGAVATVLDLADAVAHLHQRGVVHGAVDPRNVRFPGTTLSERERGRPLLAYPGLTPAYSGRAGVGDFLDPRYAPPEYYDDRVGAIDHATDVHALGLVCYRLCTGRHPYDGSLSEVRGAVLSDRTPTPSAVDPDVPDALDTVVEKATAKEKLTRYETVNAFRGELRSIDTDGR